MESIFVEDGKLILKDENQRSFQSLNAELMIGTNGATLFGLKDFLTLYASGGYTRSWSEGLEYSHTYDEFLLQCDGATAIQRLLFCSGNSGRCRTTSSVRPSRRMKIRRHLWQCTPSRTFRQGLVFCFLSPIIIRWEKNASVRWLPPFGNFVKETGQNVHTHIGYTFEFGLSTKPETKGLNNSDTDSGIIDMQR